MNSSDDSQVFIKVSSSGLGQIPMDERDSHSAFTYGGCTTPDGIVPDVPCGKQARQ